VGFYGSRSRAIHPLPTAARRIRSAAKLSEVTLSSLSPQRFREVAGDRWPEIERAIAAAGEIFRGRAIWHVNSTARGGGVAELLQSLLAYARGAGVDNRWVVIDGNPDFFQITKRIHNNLHGYPGDGGPLGDAERHVYEAVSALNATVLGERVRGGDVVFLHDPQTAGLVDVLRESGAHIVSRNHVGLDLPNDHARRAWEFLRPYVERADSYVFSRREFVWSGLDPEKVWIVPPSIDAFSPKNQEMDADTAMSILHRAGLRSAANQVPPVFTRVDGSPGRVDRRAELTETAPIPATSTVVSQVSRWDRLKDPIGVLRLFSDYVSDHNVHLLLAGPATGSVADDPEALEVLGEVISNRDALPPVVRDRVHLACLPMTDGQENAAIVNAIQQSSTVVLQKSLAEGFGLTVAEAMWKARPVVASRVGGIQDQIVHGESGILIDDPSDLGQFGAAINGLIEVPEEAARMGEAARERIRSHFLGTRHLIQYMQLLAALIGRTTSVPAVDVSDGL
jgi:trehalose synthase